MSPALIARCLEAARTFEAAVIPPGGTYQGETVESILAEAGLSEREQIRAMGLVIDQMRAGFGEAPKDTTRTECHWCGRKFDTKSGRGIHEARCRETLSRNRRIVEAYLGGMSGLEIAEAEGMGWSAVYRILREAGVMQDRRDGAA